MIIWSGAGLLVPVIFIASYLFTDTSMAADRQMAIALMVTGAASLLLGFYYRRRANRLALERAGVVPDYSRWQNAVHSVFGNWDARPAFFFIPMHFWGVIGLGYGGFQFFTG